MRREGSHGSLFDSSIRDSFPVLPEKVNIHIIKDISREHAQL